MTAGSNIYYRFSIENTGDVVLNSPSVSDPTINTAGCTWPATLPVADALDDDHIATCVVGPVTASSMLGTYPNTAKARAVYPVTSTVIESNNSTASYALPAPDLIIYKTNSAGGSVTGTSTPFTWYLTVKNSKYGDPATFNYGEIILQDDLPAAATIQSGNCNLRLNCPNTDWNRQHCCSINISKVLTCTVDGASGDSITLTQMHPLSLRLP